MNDTITTQMAEAQIEADKPEVKEHEGEVAFQTPEVTGKEPVEQATDPVVI